MLRCLNNIRAVANKCTTTPRQLFQKPFVLLLLYGCSVSKAFADVDHGNSSTIPDAVWAKMEGTTWHSNLDCPARSELRLLTIPFVDFSGDLKLGRMIVSKEVQDEVLTIFEAIGDAGFRIQQMQLVSDFDGSDDKSMDANNTSAFNCRLTTGGTRLSQHSFGTAIDINPIQNPYVTSTITLPEAGVNFDQPDERNHEHQGVILDQSIVVTAFANTGWSWGGNWSSLKDYQHFSRSGN